MPCTGAVDAARPAQERQTLREPDGSLTELRARWGGTLACAGTELALALPLRVHFTAHTPSAAELFKKLFFSVLF